MAILKHEVWEAPDDPGPTVCMAGPEGNACRSLFSKEAKLLWTFEAGSHFEAMTIFYKQMGWGEYKSEHE